MISSPELVNYRNKDLIKHMCDKIYPLGVKQCIQGTRTCLIVFLGRLAEVKVVSDIATYHCNMKALIGGENNDFAGIVTPPDLFTTNHHL